MRNALAAKLKLSYSVKSKHAEQIMNKTIRISSIKM